jgi:hypothetical protein
MFIFLQPNGYRKYDKVFTKKIFEHRLSDTLRKSKILNNAFCTRQFLYFFFWKFTYTLPIDLARCQIFAINCLHDELFKPPSSGSRKASEYFSHFIWKREFYDTYRCRCGNHGGDHLATVRYNVPRQEGRENEKY